jgi:hypothetical protein
LVLFPIDRMRPGGSDIVVERPIGWSACCESSPAVRNIVNVLFEWNWVACCLRAKCGAGSSVSFST